MSVRFLHTADWQLGKPFAGVVDFQKRVLLQQERINALERLAQVAREQGAQFVVVAGDLFDSPGATKATVSAACAAIGRFGVPVVAIPGNHDHGGPGSLWEQPFFQHERAQLAPNLIVALRAEPVELEGAVLLPCPLLRRHETTDTTAWLRALDFTPWGEKPRIALAHGSVQSFTMQADEDEGGAAGVNRIDLARLPEAELDYVALGDWHGMKQVAPKAWYAGTPEIDRFPRGAGNEPGHVLIVTAERGAPPQVTPVRTARLEWHQMDRTLSEDADLVRLEEEMEARLGQRAQQDLLRLELRGSLGIEAMSRLEQKLEAWAARLLRLDLAQDVRVAPSADELAALTGRASDPLISRVARKLHELLEGGDDEAAARAGVALRELHAGCRSL